MSYVPGLLFVVLAAVTFYGVSAETQSFNVQVNTCSPNCISQNIFGSAYALDGELNENVALHVGDTLQLNLIVTTQPHLLTMCQNSPPNNFCVGIFSGADSLTGTINTAGQSINHTFTDAGTFYYGCANHAGMGGTITVSAATIGD